MNCNDNDNHEFVRITENTITKPEDLQKELIKIRATGVSYDNEEIEEGLKCIAIPIRDYSNNVIAAISISAAATRMKEDRVPVMCKSIAETAKEISKRMGWVEA
jgi:DNA-binding IclR family transcriptional regulator